MSGLVGSAGLFFLTVLLGTSLYNWWWLVSRGGWQDMKPRPGAPVSPGFRQRRAVLLVTVGVLWLFLPALVSSLTGRPQPATVQHVQTTAVALGGLEVAFALTWLLVAQFAAESSLAEILREDGLSPAGWRHQLRAGLRGFLLSALPVAILAAAVHLLGLRPVDEPSHSMLKLLQDDPRISIVLQVAVVVVVLAPLVEEWVFRVVLQGFLQISIPPAAAVLVSAFVFAVIHPWPNPIPLLPLAIMLGLVYQRENSALAAVTVHSLFNLANLVLFLLAPEAV